ncbi:MAG TPA: hypothetical protein VE618_00375, partial [Myxococcaceae bacterium]|nr:hypothetical protein [Myxococcaceae bacterium]
RGGARESSVPEEEILAEGRRYTQAPIAAAISAAPARESQSARRGRRAGDGEATAPDGVDGAGSASSSPTSADTPFDGASSKGSK